jgi:hypothetical protein
MATVVLVGLADSSLGVTAGRHCQDSAPVRAFRHSAPYEETGQIWPSLA